MKLTVVMVVPNEFVEQLRDEQDKLLEVMNGSEGKLMQEEMMILINKLPSMAGIIVGPEILGEPN